MKNPDEHHHEIPSLKSLNSPLATFVVLAILTLAVLIVAAVIWASIVDRQRLWNIFISVSALVSLLTLVPKWINGTDRLLAKTIVAFARRSDRRRTEES